MINKIVIHEKLLNDFKNKSYLEYPQEYIVGVLGKRKDDILYVYSFAELECKSKYSDKKEANVCYYLPEEELIYKTKFEYFGTIHSHPGGDVEPSKDDIKSFRENYNDEFYYDEKYEGETLREKIMGIMSFYKKNKVFWYNFAFYDIDLNPIQIVISENRK